MSSATNTMFDIGEVYSELYESSSQFHAKYPAEDHKSIDSVYVSLNSMMASWGENIKKQIESIELNFSSFLKYQHYEITSMKDYIHSWKTTGDNYYKFKQKLRQKKEKVLAAEIIKEPGKKEEILSKRSAKFIELFPKETEKEKELKEYFGFINASTYSLIQKNMRIQTSHFSEHFCEFSKTQTGMIQDVLI